mgnify:CR=1 FL=1
MKVPKVRSRAFFVILFFLNSLCSRNLSLKRSSKKSKLRVVSSKDGVSSMSHHRQKLSVTKSSFRNNNNLINKNDIKEMKEAAGNEMIEESKNYKHLKQFLKA